MFKLLFLTTLLIGVSLCEDTFTIQGNVYYMSYPLKKNWFQAGRFCTFYNSYLIDVNTNMENIVVSEILQKAHNELNFTSGSVWTSGTDLGNEGNYYWETNGEPILYTNWKTLQPDNADNNENCIEIQAPGTYWNDRPCLTESYFICQKYKARNEMNCNFD